MLPLFFIVYFFFLFLKLQVFKAVRKIWFLQITPSFIRNYRHELTTYKITHDYRTRFWTQKSRVEICLLEILRLPILPLCRCPSWCRRSRPRRPTRWRKSIPSTPPTSPLLTSSWNPPSRRESSRCRKTWPSEWPVCNYSLESDQDD